MKALEFFQGPGWGAALLNLSAQAALLGALVFAVTKLFGRWIPPSWRAVLWFLVIARLLIPIAPPSRFSLQNLFLKPKPQSIAAVEAPLRFAIKIQDLGEAEPGPIAFPEPLPEPEAPGKSFSMRSALTFVWLAGAAASLLALGARSLLLRRRLRGADAPTESIARTLENCREEIGLRYPLRVSVSRDVASPALTGLFPARLIVPESFNQFSPEQIRKILLHELAHIKQGHLLFHWLALLARCIHWFNPIVHFAAARLREECELAADAAALENANASERIAYGETILKVLAQATAPSSALALGMAEQARHLEQRLRALAEPNRRGFGAFGIVALLALGVAGLSGADTTPLITNPPAASPSSGTLFQFTSTNELAIPTATTVVSGVTQTIPIEESRKLILQGKISEAEGLLQRAANSVGVEVLTGPIRVPRVHGNEKIEAARHLIEAGKLNDAERILKEVLKDSPDNHVASYYLDLIKEQKYQRGEPVAGGLNPTPNPHARTNQANSNPARKKILQKLEDIRLEEFPVIEETSLSDVLRQLNFETRKRDSKGGRGINFIISLGFSAGVSAQPATDPLATDPLGGADRKPEVDVEHFRIKFDPPIHDVTLRQFLDALVMVAKPPPGPPDAVLKYTVEDYAIVFSSSVRQPEPDRLYTRTFRLDPNTFAQGLESLHFGNSLPAPARPVVTKPNDPEGLFASPGVSGIQFITTVTNDSHLQDHVRAFFNAAGVDFPTNEAGGQAAFRSNGPPKKAMFYNDRKGVLFVRATLKDLDVVESALHTINTQPTQVAAAVSEPDDRLFSRSFRIDANTLRQGIERMKVSRKPGDAPPASGGNAQPGTAMADVSPFQTEVREFLRAAGVDLQLTTPGEINLNRNAVYYDLTKSILLVRATASELDTVERALHAVDANRPQIAYQAKFVEMPKEMAWRFFGENLPKAWGVSPETNVTFALSREEVAAWIKKLEQMQKVDIITAPGVTSLAGRAVRVAVEETAPVKRENGPIGPSLDLVATIRTNKMLALQSKVTWTALLALEKAEGTTNSVPKFRVRQALFDQAVPWGGSQVIFFPNSIFLPYAASGNVPVLGEIPHLGRLFRSEVSTNSREAAFVVITPTPIGPDGAPIPEPK